ncbi:MAG: hypothetical protein ACXW04_11840 [Methylobacter sp.]
MSRLASRVIKLEIQHQIGNAVSKQTDEELQARLKQLLSGIDKTKTECPNCRGCATQSQCIELLAQISRTYLV